MDEEATQANTDAVAAPDAVGTRDEPAEAVLPEVAENPSELEAMLRAGVHVGHRRARGNPKMKPFIFTTRNDFQFIDLAETERSLLVAQAFLRGVAAKGGQVLLVGTKPAVRQAVREAAERLKQPAVWTRWLGGTLTNFKTISKRLAELADLERQKNAGEFAKYTKKEALLLERQLAKLELKFGGIRQLAKLPQAVVIFDLSENHTTAREAKRVGVPVVAVADTDVDPGLVAYPVPANDDAVSSVRYLAERLTEAIAEGQREFEIASREREELASVEAPPISHE
ncbi:30S ribosomal protein S2 [Candidatus Parcubacteria bacterium]|nr:30S ribosomal protein S2 [Candidatus Parcubacteria bacterium]